MTSPFSHGVGGVPTPKKDGCPFRNEIEIPTRLSAHHINADDAAETVGRRFTERAVKFGEHENVDGEAAAAILRSRA